MRIPARWFNERITVETYRGNGAYGDVYDGPVTVLGHISGGRRAQDDEVTSEQRVMLPSPARLADGSGEVDPSAVLTPESRVTSGAVSAVARQVAEHRHPGSGDVVYVSAVLG